MSSHLQGTELFPVSKNALPTLILSLLQFVSETTPTQSFWSQTGISPGALPDSQSGVPFLWSPLYCSQHCTFKKELRLPVYLCISLKSVIY